MLGICAASCKKLIDIPNPTGQLTRDAVFLDSTTAVSAISGLYSYMYNYTFVGDAAFKTQITLTGGMASDEFYYFSGSTYDQYKNNAISINDATNLTMWSTIYQVIYQANSILEGIEGSPLSATLKNQLKGEALFVRAVSHFYLVNLYGDVPLILKTDVTENSVAARTEAEDVYKSIEQDLAAAVPLLAPDYGYANGGTRTRANKWAAHAMLARVYLYRGNYAAAVTHSSTVIARSELYRMPALDQVFPATSEEAILQFYTNVYNHTYIQDQLSPSTDASAVGPSYVLRDELLSSFEPGDARRAAWTGDITYNNKTYAYPSKYKRNSYTTSGALEYEMFLRLGEQYLIRAEANAQLNNIDEAHQDLEAVRGRAGLGRPAADDKAEMLLAIEKERRVELFAEYGHRWFDLKRTGRVNTVMTAVKGSLWKPTAALFPIPQVARSTNPKLSQNDGY